MEEEHLEIVNTIGFNGKVPNGLLVHPDGHHIIYPLGCTVIVQDLATKKQSFLSGHSDYISCLACSPSGNYLASGQVTYMGFKADIIVWQFSERHLYCRLTLHRVKVQAMAFSPSDKYLATLGGSDDNSVVIWDIERKEPLCGHQAAIQSAGAVSAIAFSKHSDNLFATGGDLTLRIWEVSINEKTRKIIPTDCNLGQLKRIVNCIEMCDDGEHMYCGTTSGDVMLVNINTCLLKQFGPQKDKYSQGIAVLKLLPSGDLIIGTGEGTVAAIRGKTYKRFKPPGHVEGAVTSLALNGNGNELFVGTSTAQMYKFTVQDFSKTLMGSCHHDVITDICFPRGSPDLFGTSSRHDVRVWHATTGQELLRITISNLLCNALEITPDGKAIITAWDDGKIRAFLPESAKLIYTIHDAHSKGVTAISVTSNSQRIISGGGEGQVRVWDISTHNQAMKVALKEHKGAITCIKIRRDDEECVTASTDGTCIIWDLVHNVRSQVLFANTLFKAVCYRPDECQVITGGTDRKVGYWETYDGAQIRELDGSESGSINGMDIYDTRFVTGSSDKLIKVWLYDQGDVTHIGLGHSGEITRVKIAPDGRHIVSVSADGAIIRWRIPPLKEDMGNEKTKAIEESKLEEEIKQISLKEKEEHEGQQNDEQEQVN